MGWHDGKERHLRGLDRLGCCQTTHKHFVRALAVDEGVKSNAARGIRLRIDVDEKRLLFRCRDAGRQVHGGGGLPHSPLLIRYGDDLSHFSHPSFRLRISFGRLVVSS